MFVVLRLISLVLVVAALLLLGADAISSLENGGKIIVRSLDQIWTLLDKQSIAAFHVWLVAHLPGTWPNGVETIFRLPGWAVTGVPGVVLAFLSGRRPAAAN